MLPKCCFVFLIRDTTLSSPAFECGRIRTVLATSFILPNLWAPFPSFNDDRYPQITSIQKLDDDLSSFFSHSNFIRASSQTFLGNNKGQIQLNNMHEHGKLLRPLAVPVDEDTSGKVQQLITVLHNEHHINEMTEKWLCQTPNPPRNSSVLYPYENPQIDLIGRPREFRVQQRSYQHLLPYYSSL